MWMCFCVSVSVFFRFFEKTTITIIVVFDVIGKCSSILIVSIKTIRSFLFSQSIETIVKGNDLDFFFTNILHLINSIDFQRNMNVLANQSLSSINELTIDVHSDWINQSENRIQWIWNFATHTHRQSITYQYWIYLLFDDVFKQDFIRNSNSRYLFDWIKSGSKTAMKRLKICNLK